MSRRFSVLLAATALCVALNHVALAQNAPDVVRWQLIQVRNVPPVMMAHWLDFAHNAVSDQYKNAKPSWAIGKTASEIKTMLSLPTGVLAVTGVDSQNTLWVLGTEAGIQQTTEKVALLDQPLRQVEVSAQYVRISDADVKMLGIDFGKGQGAVKVGMAGGNIQAQIAALVAQKRAEILTAPRVIAIFGSTASLKSTTTTPVVLSISIPNQNDIKIRQVDKVDSLKDDSVVGVTTSIGLSVTPTFNADGTLALQMGPLRTLELTEVQMQLQRPSGPSELPDLQPGDLPNPYDGLPRRNSDSIILKNLDNIPAQPITLKDGQTAVLRGLNWDLIADGNMDFLGSKTRPTNVIALITPRIIRRAEDDVQDKVKNAVPQR
ncbi:hypothetical protein B1R32_11260 [Abditibacterium utsteinense]|uniref:Type II and III secretion system protein n=1 Tax=Abditibacterium utsteinense TaxID=1960156 RepID=A0A2S8SRJ7_9BACT|nr:hypothetical protein [Abditibacterium utsteinense]PQV63405.1 hypothetical protein B1R32_11260 [Abditibacterium utsteinense]